MTEFGSPLGISRQRRVSPIVESKLKLDAGRGCRMTTLATVRSID
jgi:hypothetical protein